MMGQKWSEKGYLVDSYIMVLAGDLVDILKHEEEGEKWAYMKLHRDDMPLREGWMPAGNRQQTAAHSSFHKNRERARQMEVSSVRTL